MGFIYACYVVKLISEEEDSCKYAHTHTLQCRSRTSSATKLSAAALAFAVLPSATFSAAQALCSAVGAMGETIAHMQLFIIAAV